LLDLPGVHHFGNYRQPRLPGHFAQNPQSLEAKSLKIVRRSSRLKCAATEHVRASRLHRAGHFECLLEALDRARTRNHHRPRAAETNSSDLHRPGLRVFAGKTIGLAADERADFGNIF